MRYKLDNCKRSDMKTLAAEKSNLVNEIMLEEFRLWNATGNHANKEYVEKIVSHIKELRETLLTHHSHFFSQLS